MSLYHASAGQAEIIRTIQKDSTITDQLSGDYSEILQSVSNRNWIKYNKYCKLLAELTYHGFSAFNNLQTLGEEYTGIVQVDKNYIAIPHRMIQFLTILLEFGGDALVNKVLSNFRKSIDSNDDILESAKKSLLKTIDFVTATIPYIKALHKSLFYLHGGKYQISKRITGINYVLIRHWLKENQSTYGYKILGIFSILQIILTVIISFRQQFQSTIKNAEPEIKSSYANPQEGDKKCVLCLDFLTNVSLTKCGHLFCWECILDWLGQKQECPVCREPLKQSQTIYLQNFY